VWELDRRARDTSRDVQWAVVDMRGVRSLITRPPADQAADNVDGMPRWYRDMKDKVFRAKVKCREMELAVAEEPNLLTRGFA